MKQQGCFLILIFFMLTSFGQKTLLVEKIGRSAKYYYHVGDKIKVKSLSRDTIYKGVLTEIRDSSITIASISNDFISIKDVACVYKQFPHVRRLGIRLGEFGGVIFLVMVANNLISNSQVFTKYAFIVSGSFIAAGIISLSFSQKKCKIGDRWKVKILDGNLN